MAAIMPGCRSLQVTRPGRSLAPSDHGDNTPQIIDDRGNKSYRGRWPATPPGADQEGNGGRSPVETYGGYTAGSVVTYQHIP